MCWEKVRWGERIKRGKKMNVVRDIRDSGCTGDCHDVVASWSRCNTCHSRRCCWLSRAVVLGAERDCESFGKIIEDGIGCVDVVLKARLYATEACEKRDGEQERENVRRHCVIIEIDGGRRNVWETDQTCWNFLSLPLNVRGLPFSAI